MALPEPKPMDDILRLVKALPENEIDNVKKYMEFLILRNQEPLIHAFMSAPVSDEPETEQDLQDIEEGKKEVAEGQTESLNAVAKELGINLYD